MREHAHAQGISSYVVELLVIAVYNSLKEAEPSLTTVYERLYNLVSNPHSLKVYFPPLTWPERLDEMIAPDNPFAQYYTRRAIADHDAPLLLDPGNPTYNVLRKLQDSEYGRQMCKIGFDPHVALSKVRATVIILNSVHLGMHAHGQVSRY
jgi:hypothetical protein